MGTTVILSPHPDDAVLSLWHVLAGPGDVRVVNVFTGAPPGAGPGWWDELSGAALRPTELGPRVRHLGLAEERRKRDAVGRYETQLGALEERFSFLSRRELLRHEVVWPLPPP